MNNLREIYKILTGRAVPSWWLLGLVSLIAAYSSFSFLPIQIDAISKLLTRVSADASLTNISFVTVLSLLFFAVFCSIVLIRAQKISSSMIVVNGIMRYKDEVHIALRVATLKHLIFSLVRNAKSNETLGVMYECGRTAGADFIDRFPQTFDGEISDSEDRKWKNLSVRDKISEWTKYDKGGGWGELNIVKTQTEFVASMHHVSLFSGPVGKHVAHFMAGYVHVILERISEGHIRVTQPVLVSGPEEQEIVMHFSLP